MNSKIPINLKRRREQTKEEKYVLKSMHNSGAMSQFGGKLRRISENVLSLDSGHFRYIKHFIEDPKDPSKDLKKQTEIADALVDHTKVICNVVNNLLPVAKGLVAKYAAAKADYEAGRPLVQPPSDLDETPPESDESAEGQKFFHQIWTSCLLEWSQKQENKEGDEREQFHGWDIDGEPIVTEIVDETFSYVNK